MLNLPLKNLIGEKRALAVFEYLVLKEHQTRRHFLQLNRKALIAVCSELKIKGKRRQNI